MRNLPFVVRSSRFTVHALIFVFVDRLSGLQASDGCWQKLAVEHILPNMGNLLSVMIRYVTLLISCIKVCDTGVAYVESEFCFPL